MPAKSKASAKVGAKAKREAIVETFGNIPVDSEIMNFRYSRRHLATARDGKWRDLQYIVELDELEQVIWKTLNRIHKRDGAKILKEAADHLVSALTVSIEDRARPKAALRAAH
jgi:hypothetical protein